MVGMLSGSVARMQPRPRIHSRSLRNRSGFNNWSLSRKSQSPPAGGKQFGGSITIGGPIIKNKLFVLRSTTQATRQSNGGKTNQLTIPTAS